MNDTYWWVYRLLILRNNLKNQRGGDDFIYLVFQSKVIPFVHVPIIV